MVENVFAETSDEFASANGAVSEGTVDAGNDGAIGSMVVL